MTSLPFRLGQELTTTGGLYAHTFSKGLGFSIFGVDDGPTRTTEIMLVTGRRVEMTVHKGDFKATGLLPELTEENYDATLLQLCGMLGGDVAAVRRSIASRLISYVKAELPGVVETVIDNSAALVLDSRDMMFRLTPNDLHIGPSDPKLSSSTFRDQTRSRIIEEVTSHLKGTK